MPDASFYNAKNFQAALDAKQISMSQIDDSCERILSGWYALPPSKRFPCDGGICITKNVSTAAHKTLARNLSAASTVLLKNDGGLLPLSAAQPLTIALIGPDAAVPYTAGQGSGGVLDSDAAVSPLAAFRSRGLHKVVYSDGCTDGKPDLDGAAVVAADADVAVVFVSARSGEGQDRTSLNLSSVNCTGGGRRASAVTANPGVAVGSAYTMEELIAAVAAKQPKVVVAMAVPGPVLTTWRDTVGAILCAFLPGAPCNLAR